MNGLVAFCYDFDKTLTPRDMQEQGLMQALGMAPEVFWKETDDIAEESGMDGNLSYMRLILEKAEGRFALTRSKLMGFGASVEFFPGLDAWFTSINSYAASRSLVAEHYIISSGLREVIEGTAISGNFRKIYAGSYYYDAQGIARWPAQVVNFTNKTQFLYRIKKGSLELNDMSVNDYVPSDKTRIPFEHFVYIGDSETDIPCMSIVNSNGGFSIGVYNPLTQTAAKARRLLEENRIRFLAPADYSQGSQLHKIALAAIDKVACDKAIDDLVGDRERED